MELTLVQKIDRTIFPGGGAYLWGALSGDHNSTKRQQVMALLGHELPKAKCGYHAVIDALRAHFEISSGTISAMDNELAKRLMFSRREQ